MSQFGMQMAGGAARQKASMNLYTGLLFLAVLALIGALAFVYMQGSKLGKDGQPWQIQDRNNVQISLLTR